MAYVAVKGGRSAIEASLSNMQFRRLKDRVLLPVDAVAGGMRALIDQVMSEGSLYAPDIAAIAVKQAEGSPEEAVFLARAFRSTLPRKHYTTICHTQSMRIERRISACFKDIPGGQILGTSVDYAHRLIDFTLADETDESIGAWLDKWDALLDKQETVNVQPIGNLPKVVDYLRREGLLRECSPDNAEPEDITKKSLEFPTVRSERLQILTRGQTGAVIAFGYAALRGYGALHPTVGELRVGYVPLSIPDPFSDGSGGTADYYIGEVYITEVETLIPKSVPRGQGKHEIEFEIGYGICFGQNETKAIAMSLLDNCLETRDERYPTHNEEFVLYHIDSVESTGFISHLKLPHYVTFQAKLDSVRKSRKEGTS